MKKTVLKAIFVCLVAIVIFSLSSCLDNIINNNLTYSYYDGDSERMITIKLNSKTDNSLNFNQREGYTFLGFFTEDGIQYFDNMGKQLPEILIDGSMTVYAKYQPHELDFEFRTTDATLEKSSVTVLYGQSIGELPNAIPNDERYELDGWFNKDGSVRYSNGTVPVIDIVNYDNYSFLDGTLTMYAKYKVKEFTVTIDYRNEEIQNDSFTLSYGERIGNLSKYVKDNGVSDIYGWTDINGNELPKYIYEDITVYAVWKNYRYVTFVYGENDVRQLKVYVNPGENSVLPTEGLPGYRLIGWYETPYFSGNPINTVVYGALAEKYYAKLEETEYTLTFFTESDEKIEDMQYSYGESVSLPTLSKDGYIFAGWTNGEDSVLGYKKILSFMWGDMELYPKWVPNGEVAYIRLICDIEPYYMEQDFIFGVGEYLELPQLADINGYHFAGWYGSNDFEYDENFVIETPLPYYAVFPLYAKLHKSTPISSADDLVNAIRNIRTSSEKNKNYHLTCDIDMSGVYIEYGIDSYSGVFDGNGYKIKNFELEDSISNLAFIGVNNGHIRRLTIENALIRQIFDYETVANTSILAGENNGIISSCYVSGSVKSSCINGNTAGLVAVNNGAIIYSEADVDIYAYLKKPNNDVVPSNIGGFVASERNGTVGSKVNATIKVVIENYIGYSISQNRINVGLFAGKCDQTETGIYICEAKGQIEANMERSSDHYENASIGGFIGYLGSGTIEECKADAKISSDLKKCVDAYYISSDGIGLFVGWQNYDTTISNCSYVVNEQADIVAVGTSYGEINDLHEN